MGEGRYWLQTLGCPKNQVDSDKLEGRLAADGYAVAAAPEEADLIVVNTCTFIEAARQESVDTILELAATKGAGAKLVVTGCMAERYGAELAELLPEVDIVAVFGESFTAPEVSPVPVAVGVPRTRRAATSSQFDLLELPRPASDAAWAYVKVAEGCDRMCGFCAIPSFRGRQRSRSIQDILRESRILAEGGVQEIVLVAQDLASFGRDRSARGSGDRTSSVRQPLLELTRKVAAMVPRVRLLYLYPSGLTDALVDTVLGTGVPYFDLSLQHVSRPHLARMRRWGNGERFGQRIAAIRAKEPHATFRSSFILGYPGETEEDHSELLEFLADARLDWAGFFPFSPEDGTHALGLPDPVDPGLAMERLRECAELQDALTAASRDAMVGRELEVLVDSPGIGRSVHEAPEIDGVIRVPRTLAPRSRITMSVTASLGTDLEAAPAMLGVGAR